MISDRVKKMIEDGIAYPLAESSEEEDKEFTKLCSNENPYGPSPKAVKAIKREASNIGEYPESVPIELKENIADYVGVNPTQICVGNGSDEIMDLVEKATVNPGDEAMIPIPTFSQYELSCRSNALKLNFVKLDDYEWDEKKLVNEIDSSKIAFIGRPNNPTGNMISNEGLKELLNTGKMIVVDEAYVEFSENSISNWVNDYENLIILRTFSKMFGLAGLRIGYGVANPELIRALERVRPPFSVNRLAQKAAIAALGDEGFVEKTRETILEGRRFLQEELSKIGFDTIQSKANFIMASPEPLDLDAGAVCDYLSREEGILIRNLSGFRGASSEWVRITVGKPKENKRLVKALKRLKENEK